MDVKPWGMFLAFSCACLRLYTMLATNPLPQMMKLI